MRADQVTGGNFGSVYNIAGRFVVGDPAHAHVVVGSDLQGADGVRLYAADGVTPLIDLNIGAPFVAGSVVSGPVANATAAGSASNLTGGTVSGVNTISGRLVVGNPAAAHVVVGTDGAGADGVRLYAADGVTPLIDLNIAGTPTITSAIVQTSANPSAARVVTDANGLHAYDNSGSGIPKFNVDISGGAADVTATEILFDDFAQLGPVGGVVHSPNGTDHEMTWTGPADANGVSPSIEMHSGTVNRVWPQATYINSDVVASDPFASAVTLAAGLNSGTLSVRKLGSCVHLIGFVQVSSGAFATAANITIANAGGVPVGYRPGRTVVAAVAHTFGGGSHVSTCRVTINADGSMSLSNIQQTSVTTVWLDGVTYWI